MQNLETNYYKNYYKNKFLKYKKKYLTLKGGVIGNDDERLSEISFTNILGDRIYNFKVNSNTKQNFKDNVTFFLDDIIKKYHINILNKSDELGGSGESNIVYDNNTDINYDDVIELLNTKLEIGMKNINLQLIKLPISPLELTFQIVYIALAIMGDGEDGEDKNMYVYGYHNNKCYSIVIQTEHYYRGNISVESISKIPEKLGSIYKIYIPKNICDSIIEIDLNLEYYDSYNCKIFDCCIDMNGTYLNICYDKLEMIDYENLDLHISNTTNVFNPSEIID